MTTENSTNCLSFTNISSLNLRFFNCIPIFPLSYVKRHQVIFSSDCSLQQITILWQGAHAMLCWTKNILVMCQHDQYGSTLFGTI